MSGVTILGPDGAVLPPRTRRMSDIGGRSFYDAASTVHQDVAFWRPSNPSAQAALTYERDRMAARIHDLARNDSWASVAVTRKVDSVIGSGWKLRATPNARALGLDPKAAAELAAQIETQWRLYKENFECCDAGQRDTIGLLQALAFRHYIGDGESLSVSYWIDRGGDWCTARQIIDPDRLSNPNLYVDTMSRRAGVDLGAHGEPLAYHFRSAHPGDFGVIGAFPWIWEKFDRKLPNGRWQVVHAFDRRRAGQVRGEPPLAPIVKKMRMLGRYDEAELQAAVLNAVLAAFIKSGNDHDQIAEAMNGSDELTTLQAQRIDFYEKRPVRLPGAQINFLYPEDDFAFTQPAHPNTNFDAFYRVGLRNLAAVVGVTYEQLTGDFSQTTYSGFKGALAQVWQGFLSTKDGFAARHERPHYENWLEEAIARGRVQLPKGAPEFRAARLAYCDCSWIGPGRGAIEPVKEATAVGERLRHVSTFADECAANGDDYLDVLDQKAREREEARARGLDPDRIFDGAVTPKKSTDGDENDAPSGDKALGRKEGE